MGTLITLTADEASFLAAFLELSPAEQALVRTAMAHLAGARAAGGGR